MPDREFRVFISAATSEFGKGRDAIAAALRSRDYLVKVQSEFRQETEHATTLGMLHEYIRTCDAVVYVIGKRNGAFPPSAATEPFRHLLPKGIVRASYTQWEFFFAAYFEKRPFIFIAKDEYVADEPPPATEDSPDIQQAFIQRFIKEEGLHREYFSNVDQLSSLILRTVEPAKPKFLKPINLPYQSLGTLFKGRDDFITELRNSLMRAAHGTSASVISNAVYGLGGIGKTRLAVEYAWRYQREFNALLFIVADTPDDLRRNFAALAGPMVLNLNEQKIEDEQVRVGAALRWLQQNPGWFLIIDNVDTEAAAAEVEAFLAKLRGGKVLITSRLADWGETVERLDLNVLSGDAAQAFLLERTAKDRRKTADDDAEAQALADKLGQLALALEQAGAYINKNRLGFAEYLAEWQGNHDDLTTWFNPRLMKYPKSIAVTWQTSFDQLAEPARALLERLAWLSPEPIPEMLLDVASSGKTSRVGRAALTELKAYSLVTSVSDAPSFTLHRLVQDVTRRSLERKGTALYRLAEATRWIESGFDNNKEILIPHVVSVLHFLHDGDYRGSDASELLDPMGRLVIFTLLDTGARNISPEYLPTVLGDFYEVEPLSATIDHLIANENTWPRLQAQLLGANNYVLRYAMAASLADAWTEKKIVALLDNSKSLNEFELAGYALGLTYARHPELIEPKYLAKLAESETYPGRSILGDLFLNLAFRRDIERCRDLHDLVASDRFWKPIWDFVQLDVWAIEAAQIFMATPRRPDLLPAMAEVRQCYADFEAIEENVRNALKSPAVGASLRPLLENYFSLGQDPAQIRTAKQELAAVSKDELLKLMALFFAHPVWAVAESAATVLSSLIEENKSKAEERLGMIKSLLLHTNWRVQFGANEAAFAVRHVDKTSFYESVSCFHDHENCKIRGLCAENLFSVILNSSNAMRDELLQRFEKEIRFWLRDEDCWVLEHVFRLFHTLHQRKVEVDRLLAKGVSRLFEAAPKWYTLEREAFLRHIERRKEILSSKAA